MFLHTGSVIRMSHSFERSEPRGLNYVMSPSRHDSEAVRFSHDRCITPLSGRRCRLFNYPRPTAIRAWAAAPSQKLISRAFSP
jgi:hypothetical protein